MGTIRKKKWKKNWIKYDGKKNCLFRVVLSKRKAIKKEIKDRYGKERADKFSEHISKSIAKLKNFPELGASLRDKFDLDCDYYIAGHIGLLGKVDLMCQERRSEKYTSEF